MKAPRDLGSDFREWMGDVPPMPDDLPQRTVEETKRTRQRRRWLWFLPGPKPTAGADGRQDPAGPPAPITKPRGLSPASMEGTMTMFSVPKLVGLAAMVSLMGALALSWPVSVERAPAAPAAVDAPPRTITAVHGTANGLSLPSSGDVERHDWGIAILGSEWSFEFDVNDPRLHGMGRIRMNKYDIKGLAEGPLMITSYVENDDGYWSGVSRGYQDPERSDSHYQALLTGHGDYDGLTAILSMDQESYTSPMEVSGVIIEGSLPPIPEPVSELPD